MTGLAARLVARLLTKRKKEVDENDDDYLQAI
jgi:hypothetical protein